MQQILGRGGFFLLWPPIREQPPKSPSWMSLISLLFLILISVRWYSISVQLTLLGKLKKCKKGNFEIINNDFESAYVSLLKDQAGKCTMESKRLWTIGLEIIRNLQKMNPMLMDSLFHITKCLTQRPRKIQVNFLKTSKYGNKTLRTQGPHLEPYAKTN